MFYEIALNCESQVRNDKRKAENGFESQQRRKEEHDRKLAIETRKQDMHELDLILAHAKLDHQIVLNLNAQTTEKSDSLDVMRHILVRKVA